MRTILGYLKPFRARMAVGFLIKVFGTVVELFLPSILTYILKSVVVKERIELILAWGALMLLCAASACVANIVANRMAARVSRNFSESVRRDLFKKTLYLSNSQTDTYTIPSLESRITTDTYHVHNFVSTMRFRVSASVMVQ